MSLLTELNSDLLTESGLPLWAEGETESGTGSGTGSGTTGPIPLKAKAALLLVAKATLNSVKVFTSLPMKAKATLQFISAGILNVRKGMRVKAALRVIARQGTAQPPSGIGMQMKILTDPYRPEVIRDQVLRVWFNGHPSHCRVALKIDDNAEFQPAFTWQNPGITHPAILKIDSAAMAGDGMNHRITISVWQAVGNRTSARATLSDYAKTPIVRPATQPEWCGATGIRQGEMIRGGPYNDVIGNIPDLTRIDWRHTGAVQIMAKIPIRNVKTGATTRSTVIVGYADHDETRFYTENIGLKFGGYGGILHDVLFGVAAIQNGTFGPVTWASAPVNIRDVLTQPQDGPTTHPDEIAGTLRNVTGHLEIRTYPGTFNLEVRADVLTALGTLPTNGNAIIDQTLYRMFLKLKNITRQGGSVTLDDLGRFETRWNPDRTVRSVVFMPSPGFMEGTRAGIVLTDAQAKALNP